MAIRVEGKKRRLKANENLEKCPECKSKDVDETYVSCRCHRTYEGDGRTCWTAPKCNSCGYVGAGNSAGGVWYMPDGW